MTKSRIAEWILSQVLPPDRAGSTVGDWLEDAPARGSIWFWSSVIRTAASRVWNDLTENPLTIARIGLIGFARSVLVPIAIVLLAETVAKTQYRHILFTGTGPGITSSRWQLGLIGYPLQVWWYFQTGRWIARRLPGHELASCMAVSLVGWLALVADITPIRGATVHYVMFYILPPGIAHDLILLAGALWLRRRQYHPVG